MQKKLENIYICYSCNTSATLKGERLSDFPSKLICDCGGIRWSTGVHKDGVFHVTALHELDDQLDSGRGLAN